MSASVNLRVMMLLWLLWVAFVSFTDALSLWADPSTVSSYAPLFEEIPSDLVAWLFAAFAVVAVVGAGSLVGGSDAFLRPSAVALFAYAMLVTAFGVSILVSAGATGIVAASKWFGYAGGCYLAGGVAIVTANRAVTLQTVFEAITEAGIRFVITSEGEVNAAEAEKERGAILVGTAAVGFGLIIILAVDNAVSIALIAAFPALLSSLVVYAAARRTATLDLHKLRTVAVDQARTHAIAAEDDRLHARQMLLSMERDYDAIRGALREIIATADLPDRPEIAKARALLIDFASPESGSTGVVP